MMDPQVPEDVHVDQNGSISYTTRGEMPETEVVIGLMFEAVTRIMGTVEAIDSGEMSRVPAIYVVVSGPCMNDGTDDHTHTVGFVLTDEMVPGFCERLLQALDFPAPTEGNEK